MYKKVARKLEALVIQMHSWERETLKNTGAGHVSDFFFLSSVIMGMLGHPLQNKGEMTYPVAPSRQGSTMPAS